MRRDSLPERAARPAAPPRLCLGSPRCGPARSDHPVFSAAQAIVDAIWSDIGLRYPPAVRTLPRQARSTIARADRLSILLADRTPSWCLLHELAHATTGQAD